MTLTITCVVDNNAPSGSGLQHEHGLAFWIASGAGAVLLDTGQSGTALLLNTLEHVQRLFASPIVAIAGGIHLLNADADTLAHIARTLHGWGTLHRIHLNHCSGENADHILRRVMGDDIVYPCPAGTILEMEVEL